MATRVELFNIDRLPVGRRVFALRKTRLSSKPTPTSCSWSTPPWRKTRVSDVDPSTGVVVADPVPNA